MSKLNSTHRECDCKPGTFKNGWQEQRGKECLNAEREAFARAIEIALAIDQKTKE